MARLIFEFAKSEEHDVELTEDEARLFDESIVQEERGELASDEQVQALWKKCGL